MQNLVQLVEYITGMDTRIGYPNEHLGRSKVESVKSPMYATSVGLVLAGYQPLDQRVDYYNNVEEQVYAKPVEQKSSGSTSSGGACCKS
ncbi:hypothetical protein GCM10028895_17450 [Pontibacter rugosus]